MKSIRLMMTLFTLLGLGGVARADDRLFKLFENTCIKNDFNPQLIQQFLQDNYKLSDFKNYSNPSEVKYHYRGDFSTGYGVGNIVVSGDNKENPLKQDCHISFLSNELDPQKNYNSFFSKDRIKRIKVIVKNNDAGCIISEKGTINFKHENYELFSCYEKEGHIMPKGYGTVIFTFKRSKSAS
jgi:hypothetical protein